MTRRISGSVATLVVALCIGVLQLPAADPQPLTELLKALNASGYPSPLYPPEFTGLTIDNKKLSLSSLQGQVILINFWATWCLECRPEMAMFERLHHEFSSKGLAIVGINAREAPSTIREYARELSLTFPLIADPDGKINSRYGVMGLPTTFLISRNGRAVALAVGPREWNGTTARTLIEMLLAEPGAAKKTMSSGRSLNG